MLAPKPQLFSDPSEERGESAAAAATKAPLMGRAYVTSALLGEGRKTKKEEASDAFFCNECI